MSLNPSAAQHQQPHAVAATPPPPSPPPAATLPASSLNPARCVWPKYGRQLPSAGLWPAPRWRRRRLAAVAAVGMCERDAIVSNRVGATPNCR